MAPEGVWRVAGTGHVLLLLSVGVHAFQWTSDIQNGGKLQRCVGDNVTFPWSYVTESEENVIVQFWFSNKSGSFASYFADHFMTSWDRVTQAGPAEVTLSDVRTADDDTYGVSVMLYDRQEPLTQHLTLTVAEPPTTTDGQLRVTEHINNSTDTSNTSRPHMRLKCGEFLSLGSPSVSVFWTDPSGHRLPSTTFHNGYFYLDLEPYARGGNYTCSVPRETEATQCLASNSPLLMAAGWEVVTMETMVLDQGAELRQLRRTLEELGQQVSRSHVTHTNTSGALWHAVTALEQRQTNGTEVLEGQVAELHNTQAELRQASAEQNNTISILVNRVSELQDTNTALRQAYAEQNNTISILVNRVSELQDANMALRQASAGQNNTISSLQSEVADLQKKNADQNTQISGFQKQVSDHNTQIYSLQSQVADQNTHISSLQSQVADLKNIVLDLSQNTRISGLQQQVTDQNAQISSLQKENAEQNTQISSLQKENAEQNTHISSLQKENAEKNTQISSLQKENAEQNTQISDLRNQASDQRVQFSSLQKQVSEQNTQISRLQKESADQNTKFSGLQKQVSDQNTQISGLQKQVSDQNTQISGLQKQVSDQNIQISGLQKQVSDQNTQISGIQKQTTDQNTQISGLQKKTTNLNTQISSLETENAEVNTQISGLKKENADQKTQISSLQSDLQTVRTDYEKADVDINWVLNGLGQNLTIVTSQLMTKTDRLQVSQESLSSNVRAQTQQLTSLQTGVSSLQGDVNRGGTTLTTLQTELGRINALTAPLQKKAGFYVYLATPTVNANRPVVFKLGSHVGGGYDDSSGVYTAPYSGWYTLQAQLFPHRDSDTNVWFDIILNAVIKARAGCYQKSKRTFTCTTSISMYVAKGDRLWVQPHDGGRYWTAPFDSFFSGVLVTPD